MPEPGLNADGTTKEPSGAGTKTEAEIRAEVESEIQTKFKDAIANNEAYKSMQRVVSRQAAEKQALEAEITRLKASHSEMREGFEFLGKQVMELAPEDQRERVKGELAERRLQKAEQELAQLRQPPATQATQGFPDDFQEQLARIIKEAREGFEETVRAFGLDPKDPLLDFGNEQADDFPTRQKKLNQSIKVAQKAKEVAELEAVRQKVTPPATRTSGGTPVGEPAGDLLEMGAREAMEKIRAGSPSRAGR